MGSRRFAKGAELSPICAAFGTTHEPGSPLFECSTEVERSASDAMSMCMLGTLVRVSDGPMLPPQGGSRIAICQRGPWFEPGSRSESGLELPADLSGIGVKFQLSQSR